MWPCMWHSVAKDGGGGVVFHAYTSSKHAITGLTKNVVAELGFGKC